MWLLKIRRWLAVQLTGENSLARYQPCGHSRFAIVNQEGLTRIDSAEVRYFGFSWFTASCCTSVLKICVSIAGPKVGQTIEPLSGVARALLIHGTTWHLQRLTASPVKIYGTPQSQAVLSRVRKQMIDLPCAGIVRVSPDGL